MSWYHVHCRCREIQDELRTTRSEVVGRLKEAAKTPDPEGFVGQELLRFLAIPIRVISRLGNLLLLAFELLFDLFERDDRPKLNWHVLRHTYWPTRAPRAPRLRICPLPIRLIAWMLVPIMLATSVPLYAWEATNLFGLFPPLIKEEPKETIGSPQPVLTPQNVKVNKTVPRVRPPPLYPEFGTLWVTDEEIFRARVFGEPLIPIGETTFEENKALSAALQTYLHKGGGDGVEPIMNFLHEYPASPWRASLLLNLGIIFRNHGWFSKALIAWEQAWDLSKNAQDIRGKAVADRSVAEWAVLNARVGRTDVLERIFSETKDRQFRGRATELMADAKGSYEKLINTPETSCVCGPLAVQMVRRALKLDQGISIHPEIRSERASRKGTSLEQNLRLMRKLGMNYQTAKREPGAEVILPSLVHWKVGHFAAITRQEGGRYLVQDPTFDYEIWVSRDAIDAEASGYFLVPEAALPQGWKSVAASEGAQIWGQGPPSGDDQNRTGCEDEQSGCNSGTCGTQRMAEYSFHTMLVSLHIADSPVGYSPPLGPSVQFQVSYNQREVNQPDTFTYSNLGSKWTFNWLAYIEDNPTNSLANVKFYARGSGAHVFSGFDTNTQTFAFEKRTAATLVRTSSTSYELRKPDGSKVIFGQADGAATYPRKVFMTQQVDPAGNAVGLTFDGSLRITAITDAIGQVTTLSYEHGTNNLLITKVTDPFGRYASFEYDSDERLKKITDVIGITSEFTYEGSGDFINSLTTPYGTTTFRYANGAWPNRWLDATDPLGQTERLERTEAGGLNFPPASYPSEDVPAGEGFSNGTFYRNSFYWSKKAMQGMHKDGPFDYGKAEIYQFLHVDSAGAESGILQGEKKPLENRVWYAYPGQTDGSTLDNVTVYKPKTIARVLDDGTQVYRYAYDSAGNMTNSVDPSGRQLKYVYSTNNIDLLEIRQTTSGANELLMGTAYNSQHLPTVTTNAAGQVTSFAYNTNGQLTSIVNTLGQTNSFSYTSNYLTMTTGPIAGATNTFTYDSYGRVRTSTDSDGYTLTYDYDALDRVTKITYPDATYDQFVYTLLDQTAHRDRLGRWTRTFYNSMRRPLLIQDAANRRTQFQWCDCGSLEAIVDPEGNTTSWNTDLQGRVIAKTYDDGTSYSYTYENKSSRLKSMTDPKNQSTYYSYFVDNNLASVSYSNAVVSTPSVSFTYSSNYNRVATMVDGVGTTTYAYNTVDGSVGAGMLSSIDGPLSNDVISYTYDELGRVAARAINGSTNSVSYDALGRVTSVTNALGGFSYGYDGSTERLSSVAYPNGQTNSFSYYGNTGDHRLQQIHNKSSTNSTISKFDYEYNAQGQITKWTKQAGSDNPVAQSFEYDAVDQLIAGTFKDTITQAIVKRYVYGYDEAGNRTSEQIDDVPLQASYNNLNQLTSQESGGPTRFKGSISETGTVTVAGVATTMTNWTSFVGSATLPIGTNTVSVVAQDYSTNVSTNMYSVVVSNLVNRTLLYDDNGNMTNDGTRSYEWDAANRITKISQSTNYVAFTYDGAGRRVRIVDVSGSTTNSDKRYLWCGPKICEQRDSGGSTVQKQFFEQGVRDSSTNYFYAQDHLGSVREVTDTSQTVVARYDYDPYGRRTKLSGSYDADFGYTGHFTQKPSWTTDDHVLTPFRVYRPDLGRWLSRDPLGERADLNLFAYVHNNVIGSMDPFGLVEVNPGNINCVGHACGVGSSVMPSPGQSMQGMMASLGYKCKYIPSGSGNDCSCEPDEDKVVVYIYAYGYNPSGGDPFSDPWVHVPNVNDVHAVHQELPGLWSQIMGDVPKPASPDYLTNPDDAWGPGRKSPFTMAYCCCKCKQ